MRFEIVQVVSDISMVPLLESLNLLDLTIHKVGELQVSAVLFNNCYWFKLPYETTDDTIDTYNNQTPLVPFSTANIQGVSMAQDYVRYRVSEFTGNVFLNGLIKNRAAMKTQLQEMDPYWQSQILAKGDPVTIRFLTQMAQQNINVLSTLVMNYQTKLQELYTKYQYQYFIQGTSSYGTGYHYPITMTRQQETDVEVIFPDIYGSMVFYLPYVSRMPKLFLSGRLTNITEFLNQFIPLSFSPGDVFVYYLTFKKPGYVTLSKIDPIDYTYKINVTLT
jgi:hypothetical protein